MVELPWLTLIRRVKQMNFKNKNSRELSDTMNISRAMELSLTTEYFIDSVNLTKNQTEAFGDSSYQNANPRRDALYIVIPITIIYLSIFLTGTIGNVSTCIVIARNKSMHTATNYYLFSLAVSDLLLLISGLPAEVYSVWSKYPYIFGEGFCVLRGLAAECSTNASVLTITAFTIERYVAICHPFLSQTMSKLSRAIKLILIIWLIALCFAIPQALQFGLVEYHSISPDFIVCTLRNVVIQHSFELSTFLFFIVPMTLITVLYALIGLKLRKSNIMKRTKMRSQRGGYANGGRRKNCRHSAGRSSRRVLKMLVAVVIAFFICWAPFHVQRLIAIYGTGTDHISSKSKWMEFLYHLFTYISGVLYYVSTTINPILYNIMSHKFREAFMETLSRSCGGSTLSVKQEQRSYSSLSRSQQRTVGGFGSRTVGTATAMAQESSDCSGNSIKMESPQQNTSIKRKAAGGSSRILNSVCRITPGRLHLENHLSIDDNQSNEAVVDSNSLEDQRSADVSCDNPRRLQSEDESRILNKQNFKNYIGLRRTTERRGEKWWRLFKWIHHPVALKFNATSGNFSDGIADIENNREEYSMATCYVANEHRFV